MHCSHETEIIGGDILRMVRLPVLQQISIYNDFIYSGIANCWNTTGYHEITDLEDRDNALLGT